MAACNWLDIRRGAMVGYYLSVICTHNINPQRFQLVRASDVHVRVTPQTQTLCIRPWRTEADSSRLFRSKNKPRAQKGISATAAATFKTSHAQMERKEKPSLFQTAATCLSFGMKQPDCPLRDFTFSATHSRTCVE